MLGVLDTAQWVILGLSELVAVLLIIRLWGGQTGNLFSRLIWSVTLLIPIIGPILFLWLRPGPAEHSYECEDATGQVDPGGDLKE